MKIWVDSDACPKMIKEVLYKTSYRLKIQVCFVANSYMAVPKSLLITSIQVDSGADVADTYIVDRVHQEDLVITADIPLAKLIVEKEAIAINPRGEVYTEENIRERASVRDFMQDLRDSGVNTGGPPPFGAKDKESFCNSLNRILTKLKK